MAVELRIQPLHSGAGGFTNNDTLGQPQNDNPGQAHSSSDGVQFGSSSNTSQAVSFGTAPSGSSDVASRASGQSTQSDQGMAELLNQLLGPLLEQAAQMLQMLMQLFQAQAGGQSSDSDGSGAGSAGGQVAALQQPAAPPEVAQQSTATAPTPTPSPSPTSAAAQTTPGETSDAQVSGSGPRTKNFTNNEDHDIHVGKFNQQEQLTGELVLKPGETGQMKYENDSSDVTKVSDADGNYKPDATRYESFNGFENVSDIDGHNATMFATDHKGFEIGTKESVADQAPADLVTRDSGGNKTVAGWYDGSTDAMRKGGEFLEGKYGTGMTYIHPDDDRRAQGSNPMRHTDATTVDIAIGKA